MTSETVNSTRQAVSALMADQRFAVLATQSDGDVLLSLMSIVATQDLTTILFATERDTRKFTHLSANRRVAMLVDNRSNDEADLTDAIAVSIRGSATELPADERQVALELFVGRHPSLEDFVSSDTCALMAVTVESYQVVSRFQDVEFLVP